MRAKQTEVQLGEVLVEFLASMRLHVHQEVQLKFSGDRCDVVAVRDQRWVWAIELKTRFGLDVLAQAERWIRLGYVHRTSIAVPHVSHTDGARLGYEIAKSLGIGILQISGTTVSEIVAPRFHRAPRVGVMLQRLEASSDTGNFISAKAGTNGGGFWTPFRNTCRLLSDYVREHPGASMKETIEAIKHHYASFASARAHMMEWCESGNVEGVELRREGRKITLWPKTPVGGVTL